MKTFKGQINGKDFTDEKAFKEELEKAISSGNVNASMSSEYHDDNQTSLDFDDDFSKKTNAIANECIDNLFPSEEELKRFLNSFTKKEIDCESLLQQLNDALQSKMKIIKDNWSSVDLDDFLIRRSRLLKKLSILMDGNKIDLEESEKELDGLDNKINELNEEYHNKLKSLNARTDEELSVYNRLVSKKLAIEYLNKFFTDIVSNVYKTDEPIKTECKCKQEQKETPYTEFDTDKFLDELNKIVDWSKFGFLK